VALQIASTKSEQVIIALMLLQWSSIEMNPRLEPEVSNPAVQFELKTILSDLAELGVIRILKDDARGAGLASGLLF